MAPSFPPTFMRINHGSQFRRSKVLLISNHVAGSDTQPSVSFEEFSRDTILIFQLILFEDHVQIGSYDLHAAIDNAII